MQHQQPNTTLQGGKYRIDRLLGQGGFGITYLAIQVSSNRQVAIKELFIGVSGQPINDRRGNQVVVANSANQQSFNQQKAKFKKEALRLANLNHPNLVEVHESFEENGTDSAGVSGSISSFTTSCLTALCFEVLPVGSGMLG